MTSISTHDVRADNAESFYHGFVLGLLALVNPTHKKHVRSNLESGLGRFDITLEPRNPRQGERGIIFELKRLHNDISTNKTEKQVEKLLEQSAKEGLAQIKDKAYATDLKSRGIDKMTYVALAFCGKQMAYLFEELN